MEYKVGDKVVFIDEEAHARLPRYYPEVGTIGEIVEAHRRGDVAVRWSKGSTAGNGVWLACRARIKPYQPRPEKIYITRKGNEVHCVKKVGGKEYHTVAKCAPKDTFDFDKGAMIAMMRMMEV